MFLDNWLEKITVIILARLLIGWEKMYFKTNK
jgi:hypothetical protein